jgi:hypothetical protein
MKEVIAQEVEDVLEERVMSFQIAFVVCYASISTKQHCQRRASLTLFISSTQGNLHKGRWFWSLLNCNFVVCYASNSTKQH